MENMVPYLQERNFYITSELQCLRDQTMMWGLLKSPQASLMQEHTFWSLA